MKKVFLAVVMFVGITTLAQEKQAKKGDFENLTTEQKVELQVKRMAKDLDLNEKQVKDMKVLVAKEVEKKEAKRDEMKQLKTQNEQKRGEMKAQMEKEQAEASAEMKKILTPEQYTKWEKMRDERRANMREKMMEKKKAKMMEKDSEPLKK
jgi:hypothetical protein